MTADGWFSVLSGLGVQGRDKRIGGEFLTDILASAEAQDLWRGDDLAARVVETWPNEMLRQGFELRIADDPDAKDTQEAVQTRWEELGLVEELWMAAAFECAYGGAGILLGVNDGQGDLSQPLIEERVATFDWITTFEPDELVPLYYYADPRAPKFGRPEVYRLQPISPGTAKPGSPSGLGQQVLVHESRLVVFPGIRVSRRQVGANAGWGDSKLTRFNGVLRDFELTWAAAGILLQDFAQAVFKIKGLADIASTDQGEALKARMQAVELSRSTARAVLIDAEEEFERKQTPISGLPEMLDRFATRLAAAADMPLTLLMGQSPAGLNATGESDIRFFYDRVRAAQDRKLRPAIEKITTLVMRAEGIEEPERWSIEFRPLWQPTAKEQAESRLIQAQTDQIYIVNGVLSPEEVAESRFAGDEYSFETKVDFANREELSPAPVEEEGAEELQAEEEEASAETESEEEREDSARMDKIEKRGRKWYVLSGDGSEVLGIHDTEEGARRQLRAVEAAKKRRRG